MNFSISKVNLDFKPKLFTTIRHYSKERLMSDLMAGVIVGIVALPLAIAFGIASGVSPEEGLITAIIGGFIVSLLGGCSVQIGGPTGAFIVIVSGIIQQFGIGGLAIATVIAGVMLIGMGILRLGTVIKFMPYPIIVGFTSGIALTIFSTQVKDLLGLNMDTVPSSFISKWIAYGNAVNTINIGALITGIVTILIIIYSSRWIKKIPGTLIAILIVTVVVYFLRNYTHIPVIQTIGDYLDILSEKVGKNGSTEKMSLFASLIASLTWDKINLILPAAFTIAMLGAIESLLSATVADGITGDRQNSNTELIAQGAANLITPIFGGIPVTGAIARTMTNINNGGRTPIAGIVHAIVLLLILLFLGPLTKHIPMACLAGVLIVVSYNMSEWRTFLSLLKNPKSDIIVLLVTFFLTVIFDLTIAIEVGILLAMVLLVRRISETSHISIIKDKLNMETDAEKTANNDELVLPKGVEVYEIDGPFFFGIANKFEESMRIANIEKPKIRIIRMRKVPFMDSTGLHNLESLYRLSNKDNIQLVLSGVNDTIKTMLNKSGLAEKLGKDNICSNINEALKRVNELTEN